MRPAFPPSVRRLLSGSAASLLLVVAVLAAPLFSEPELSPGVRVGESGQWDFLVYGEVTAIQKNNGAMRVSGAEPAAFRNLGEAELQDFFLKKNPELTLRDGAGLTQGSFTCTRVLIEYGERPRGLRQITLSGYFNMRGGEADRILTVGYQAGLYRKRIGYLPPTASGIPPRQPLRQLRHQVDGKIMLFIPEDVLVFGQGDAPSRDNFNPFFYSRREAEQTRVKAFYIDKYEVTNAEYYRFLRAAGHPPPPAWRANGGRFPAGQDELPVTVASFTDAEAYARWSGKRLPTELEWELAARGGLSYSLYRYGREGLNRDPQIYPTGNEFFADRCNTLESGHGAPVPVTQTRDASPFGVMGLCGNAREWTSSWYEDYPGRSGVFSGTRAVSGRMFKVIRGGSYSQKFEYARADFRDYGGFPTLREDRSAGFRLTITAQ